MSVTLLADVANQVEKFWSPLFMPQLMQSALLPSLVNKDYEGDIKKGGNTVRVSQVNRPVAELKTIGVDAESFSSSLLSTSYIDIVANKRITASYEMEDVLELQSQVGQNNPAIMRALMEAVEIKLNEYLFSFIAPSASAPDHITTGVTDFNAAALLAERNKASAARWDKMKPWYGLVSSSYYGDLLAASTLTSSDYIGAENPVVAGQIAKQRFGFNLLEDNSDALVGLGSTGSDAGLFFHPDFLHLVMQRQPTFQVSSLHSNKQHGVLISVDLIVGAALGINGNVKHTTVINS